METNGTKTATAGTTLKRYRCGECRKMTVFRVRLGTGARLYPLCAEHVRQAVNAGTPRVVDGDPDLRELADERRMG
jgi:hypothetical protein